MFEIHALPAGHGDCLWIVYGKAGATRNILIDGGTSGSYKHLKARIAKLPVKKRSFELLIITHVDADHIGGVLKLLTDTGLKARVGEIWFNGYVHLVPELDDLLGPVQGETLTELLVKKRLSWNQKFGRKAVVAPRKGRPPTKTLEGGMKISLLSPTRRQLDELAPEWEKTVEAEGLVPGRAGGPVVDEDEDLLGDDLLGDVPIDVDALAAGKAEKDHSEANGSSIAAVFEFDGRRALLTGDAFAPVLSSAVRRLAGGRRRLDLDLLKISHHGSHRNVSQSLLRRLNCDKYLVCTNGDRFKHPSRKAIARIVKFGGRRPIIHFNYRSSHNDDWDDEMLKLTHRYETRYAKGKTTGITVSL